MNIRIVLVVVCLLGYHLNFAQSLYLPSGSSGIGSSSTSNIGIGTANPNYLFKVYSPTWSVYNGISISSAGAHLSFRPRTATVGDWELIQSGLYGDLYFGRDSRISKFRGYLELIESDEAVKVRLSKNGKSYFNGGNVGIGRTDPAYTLDVNGISRIKKYLYISSVGTDGRGLIADDGVGATIFSITRH